jgi:hypothetical protein
LDQDAPVSRPVQQIGRIVSHAWLAGCITNTSESRFSARTTHLIACIFNAALRDFFGLAERSAHANDCGLMFFGPRLPSGYPLFLLRESLRFWQGIPCCHSRVRLAPEKHREKSFDVSMQNVTTL